MKKRRLNKWMPMRLVRPGRIFSYKQRTYLRIKGHMTIGKTPVNLVHIASGEPGWLDQETAVWA
jgi:hypothetical protein